MKARKVYEAFTLRGPTKEHISKIYGIDADLLNNKEIDLKSLAIILEKGITVPPSSKYDLGAKFMLVEYDHPYLYFVEIIGAGDIYGMYVLTEHGQLLYKIKDLSLKSELFGDELKRYVKSLSKFTFSITEKDLVPVNFYENNIDFLYFIFRKINEE